MTSKNPNYGKTVYDNFLLLQDGYKEISKYIVIRVEQYCEMINYIVDTEKKPPAEAIEKHKNSIMELCKLKKEKIKASYKIIPMGGNND